MSEGVSESKSGTTVVVKSESSDRVSMSRDPLLELCKRLFRDPKTQSRAAEFLEDVLERKSEDDPVQSEEWKDYLDRWEISRSSFYSMRNQLIGGGLLVLREGEYHPSAVFSKDMRDMADWWEAQVDST